MKRLKKMAVACLITVCLAGCNQVAGDLNGTAATLHQLPAGQTEMKNEAYERDSNGLVYAKIPAPSLANNKTGEDTVQRVCVYLPPDYETSGKDYPVLYFLPGWREKGQFSDVERNNYYGSLFLSSMNKRIEDGQNADMIIVSINGESKLVTSFFSNSPITGNWQDFVTQDVIGYVDSTFRTKPSAEYRGIAGHAIGGFGALQIAMQKPGLFDSVYLLGPVVFDENGLNNSYVSPKIIKETAERFANMNKDEAQTEFLDYIEKTRLPFSLAYACTFAYDENGSAPYYILPNTDVNGQFADDEIKLLYDKGLGDLANKLDTYQENLKQLSHFKINYRENEGLAWVTQGCLYLAQELKERGIAFEFEALKSGYVSDATRIETDILPYFAQALGLEG